VNCVARVATSRFLNRSFVYYILVSITIMSRLLLYLCIYSIQNDNDRCVIYVYVIFGVSLYD
jgi:hypothetical protein